MLATQGISTALLGEGFDKLYQCLDADGGSMRNMETH